MALNTNYDYPTSGYSSPFSSTPTGLRTQRSRFGYSSSPMYPISRSLTSDKNIDSFSDSMVNNYGTSPSRIDTTFNSENRNLYNDSYNTSGSNYYSANESFSHCSSYGESSMMHNDLNSLENDGGFMRNSSMMYEGKNMTRGYSGNYSHMRPLPRSDIPYSVLLSKPTSLLDAPKYNYSSTSGLSNSGKFKGNLQKNSTFADTNNKPYFPKKQKKTSKMATTKTWRCDLCSIDFTSIIPYDMHLRGSKHAKKLKAQHALVTIQSQADNPTLASQDDKKALFCELCNVRANSFLQFQTHLDGSKHKNKLQPKEASSQPQSQEGSKDSISTTVNGKTNGSLVRPLPSDFGEPQPSKLAKFACEVCNVAVNSEIQLQQHLISKKHQNKLEGKPVTKGKKVKKDNGTTAGSHAAENTSKEQTSNEIATKQASNEMSTKQASNEMSTKQASNEMSTKQTSNETSTEQASNEPSTKVIGVKTLASSFVQGETLQ